MPFAGIINPDQLKILRQAVDQYCCDCYIVDEQEQQYVGHLAKTLFDLGEATLNDLLTELERAIGTCCKT